MDSSALAPLFHREKQSHKYQFGHVLILGGSPGMVGAPLLAGKAALRIGAGLVTIASGRQVATALNKRVEELMTLSLPTGPGALAQLLSFISNRHVSVLVIGNGFSEDQVSGDLIRGLLTQCSLPAIIDGGGIGALSDSGVLRSLASARPLILTPHMGEFSRLIGYVVESADARDEAESFVSRTGTILVVKGQPTYVASSGHDTFVNDTGNPGMATAGTGDVLAGMIGGLLAQHVSGFDAAVFGVNLHGYAGDLAAASLSEPGMIASDVISFIPDALQAVKNRVK